MADQGGLKTALYIRPPRRDSDFVARYGGEEFAVRFAGAAAADAEARLTRVFQKLASLFR